ATDGVDLVDEDDARGMFLGLIEHVADTGSTHADEHLDEVGTGNGEEGDLGLASDGLGEQGLAGTGWADHQHAARNAAAEALELARGTQERDQLADFLLGLVAAGDGSQGGLHLILGEQPRLGFAEAHRPALAAGTALHLAHEEHEHRDDHQDREAGHQQLGPDALPLRRLTDDLHVVVEQILHQAAVLDGRTHGLEARAVEVLAGDHVAVDGDFLNPALLNLLDEIRIGELARIAGAGEVVHHRDQDCGDDQPQDQILCHVVQLSTLWPTLDRSASHVGWTRRFALNLLHIPAAVRPAAVTLYEAYDRLQRQPCGQPRKPRASRYCSRERSREDSGLRICTFSN